MMFIGCGYGLITLHQSRIDGPTYVLVTLPSEKKSNEAAMKYFLLGRFLCVAL